MSGSLGRGFVRHNISTAALLSIGDLASERIGSFARRIAVDSLAHPKVQLVFVRYAARDFSGAWGSDTVLPVFEGSKSR